MEKDDRITETMLMEALASQHKVDKSKISLDDWTTSSGSGVSDNFACDMVAISGEALVNNKPEHFDYMAKLEPSIEHRRNMLREMEVCTKEYLFYNDIVPLLNDARGETGLEPLKLPKCFYASPDLDVLILENLRTQGFDMRKSMEDGMTETEIRNYMEALGSLHATTYHVIKVKFGDNEAFIERYPALANLKRVFAADDPFKAHMDNIARNIDVIIREYMTDEIADRFNKFAPRFFEVFQAGLHKPFGDFRTLIHGDSWANNAMFKHDSNGLAEDIRMFDYQCNRISSPAVDLSYCIVTGSTEELRSANVMDWLKLYHGKFSSDLSEFGHDANEIYGFDKLLEDYESLYGYGFTWAANHCQIMVMKAMDSNIIQRYQKLNTVEEKLKVLEEIKTAMKEQLKTNRPYRERMLGLLKEAEAKKLF